MSGAVELRGSDGVAAETLRFLESKIAKHDRLTTALKDWAGSSPSGRPVLQVKQDEFSHDVVLQIERALFLVYEVT